MAFSGSNVLITGASSGLGLAVSKRFAGLGARTILVCRTREAGERTVAEIREEVPGATARPLVCDLASLASIDRLVLISPPTVAAWTCSSTTRRS